MNDIATRSAGAVASLQNLKSGLQNVQSTMPQRGGEPILKMNKQGEWLYGAEQVEVEEGSLWAVNPLSLQHGYISWDTDNASVEGEVMVPMTQPLPAKGSLPNTGFPWADQISIQLKCVSGEDKGEQVIYKPSSVGGLGAIRELIKEIMARLDTDPEHPCPVVVLESDSYKHKKWGKIFNPLMRVDSWLGMDGVASETQPEPEPEAEKADTTKQAVASEPETVQDTQADDPGPEAATRRRRRRA